MRATRNARPSLLGATLVLALLAGCGGGTPAKNDAGDAGGPAPDAAGGGGASGTGGDAPGASGGGGGGGGTGASGSDGGDTSAAGADGGADTAADATPADGGDADGGGSTVVTRIAAGGVIHGLVAGKVTLIGSGPDSCTNQRGATGDRWCAFTKPSASLGFDELWVINVSRAAAGTTIKCDGTDSSCLRLSTGLFADPDQSFRIHGFDGDTLIYYAELGPTAVSSFVGPVWAWRPGWTKGRKLTSDTGVVCNGHPTSATAICFEGADTSVAHELSFELHAGVLGAADTGPLPKVEKLLTSVDTDPADLRKFQADLSPDGAWVMWSARTTAAGPEVLSAQKVGDAASRITVATDVSRWAVTPDGTRWLWLRAFNHDPDAPSGTLETAPFPGGAGPAMVTAGVADYEPVAGGGVLYRTTALTQLRLMPDTAAPAMTRLLDQGVLAVLEHSEDGTTAVYVKDVSFDRLTDLFVRNAAAAVPCTLSTSTTAIPTATLLSKNGLVAWAAFDELASVIRGQATPVATCTTGPFATNIAGWTRAGDETLVYLDEFAPDGSDRATLRVASVGANGTLPAKGSAIAADVASIYAQLVPALPAIVFAVQSGSPSDGLYVYVGRP